LDALALAIEQVGCQAAFTTCCVKTDDAPGFANCKSTGFPRVLRYFCNMDHSPGFLKIVNEARPYVKEVSVDEARERLAKNPNAILMDVREDKEWEKAHATQAVHLGKGIFERDLEKVVPDVNREIIMYCGGGYRSVLTAEVAQRMGYRNVHSLKGGYKALAQAQWPMKSGE
jgi:rhodanese-related sulfurtransferase